MQAQFAGARLELPSGDFADRDGVSAKAIICLDRLAVLFGSLRAAYSTGYRYIRSPYPPSSPNFGFHRNEFTLPNSSQRMASGPFIRHIKELEARARGEPPHGPSFSWFDDDRELVAAAKARHLRYYRGAGHGRAAAMAEEEDALQAALRASRQEADEEAHLEAVLRLSRQVY